MKIQTLLKSLSLTTCALALAVMPASALEKEDFDFNTTKALYNLCSTSPDHGDYASAIYACRGFIEGAAQYHDGIKGTHNIEEIVCAPKGTTIEEGRIAFVAWAESNMQDTALMKEIAVKGLVRALSTTYPCEK